MNGGFFMVNDGMLKPTQKKQNKTNIFPIIFNFGISESPVFPPDTPRPPAFIDVRQCQGAFFKKKRWEKIWSQVETNF